MHKNRNDIIITSILFLCFADEIHFLTALTDWHFCSEIRRLSIDVLVKWEIHYVV